MENHKFELATCEDRLLFSFNDRCQIPTQQCEICVELVEKTSYTNHLAQQHFCTFGSSRNRKSKYIDTEPVRCLKCKYMVHYRDRSTNIKTFKRHFSNNHHIGENNSQVKKRSIFDHQVFSWNFQR